MTYEEMQTAALKQPFVPFRLLISTGLTFEIHHPDLIVVDRRSILVGVITTEEGTDYDRSIRIDLLHVVAIEVLPPLFKGTNGIG